MRLRIVGVAALLAVSAAAQGLASKFDPRPDALKMAREAERIVLARCLRSEPRTVEPGGAIFTFTEFETLDLIKGRLPAKFTLRLFGGTIAGVTVEAEGTPRFEPGEELLLLLGPDNQAGYPTLGLQSFYRTRRDETGRWTVDEPVYGLTLLRAGTQDVIPQFSTSYYAPLAVEDLTWSIRQALGQPAE